MKEDTQKNTTENKSEVALKEEKILAFWNDNNIFKKSLEKEAPNGNFVTYDGPPFATGLPHYGHVLPGTIKDIIPRYQTMLGKRVLRRWGWDCHGLPVENLVEKELGLSSKKDIEEYGVEKFNKVARNSVLRYADEWKKIIPRVGRWVDMDNDYRTMDSTYTESVWWSFKTLFDKGLIYQGYRVMLYCPHDETPLSNFEVNQGYKDITDISVYVKFALEGEENTFIIAWTTTPWTLPGNVALAINRETTYVKAKKDGTYYIVAKDLAEKVLKENYEIAEEFAGEKLLGKSYTPVFDYYNNDKLENRENAWKIYHGDFVTTESGTGVVHIAPAFGEDDMNLAKENNLPIIVHVASDGTFKPEVKDFAGLKVKPIEDHQKGDVEIIKYLAGKGVLFAKEKIVHSYPHCWRCGTPLLNYATTSWFVKVTAIRDRMVELNKQVGWTPPEIGEGRFGKWLEGARDWNVSRSRYWGAPLPIWINAAGETTVIGSIDDVKKHVKKSGNTYVAVRHGEAEHNILGVWSSKVDDPHHLTEKGKEEVRNSAEKLKDQKFDFIIASPFLRTKETAEIIAENLGVAPDSIIFDKRLREWSVGVFDEKPINDYFKTRRLSEDTYTYESEGGESYRNIIKRAGEFLYDLESKYKGKKILIVSHGGVVRALNLVAEGVTVENEHKLRKNFRNYDTAEFREIPFVPLPHNEYFELDLHRPYIDEVELVDEKGDKLTRVPEVFDTWYDSGSMPFAQQHYPFENKEEFEKQGSALFPADFIAEGLDQTRGWFYTLLVLSVGLFDRAPYEHVLVNGLVLAEDGRKMSKSLKNYPDLMGVVNKFGADSLRYYLIASPLVKAEDFNFSEKGVDEVYKKVVQKLQNVVSFYELYAGDLSKVASFQGSVLDSWIISRLVELRNTVTESLDSYELDRALRPFMDFIDDLSTWYVRRSRDRFKSDNEMEKEAAVRTTAFVLKDLSKIMAPFMPFLAEEIYQKVKSMEGEHAKESVHLTAWPNYDAGDVVFDAELTEQMKQVREVVSSALELRQKAGHKVRQPLASLTIPQQFSDELLDIIADEVNVKKVASVPDTQITLDTNLTDDLRNEGIARDIIRAIQDARKKENLNPSDPISLIIFADDAVKKIIEEYKEMIVKPTLVTGISNVNEAQMYEVTLEGNSLSFSIHQEQ